VDAKRKERQEGTAPSHSPRKFIQSMLDRLLTRCQESANNAMALAAVKKGDTGALRLRRRPRST
jgi:hypothetical protein